MIITFFLGSLLTGIIGYIAYLIRLKLFVRRLRKFIRTSAQHDYFLKNLLLDVKYSEPGVWKLGENGVAEGTDSSGLSIKIEFHPDTQKYHVTCENGISFWRNRNYCQSIMTLIENKQREEEKEVPEDAES